MTIKYRVKREHWAEPSYLLPSGLKVIPIGRRSIMCEMGLHKWSIKYAFGVPFLSCSRCGFLAPKPVLEHTATRKELIERTQKEMEKGKPILPAHKVTEKELQKAKEKLVVKCCEKFQKFKRTKRGTWKYIGDKR